MAAISIIGMGPGPEDYLLPLGRKRIDQADIIAGAPRYVTNYTNTRKEIVTIETGWNEAIAYFREISENKKVALLVSGDPCLYSFTAAIQREMPSVNIEIIPGISSFQYLAAKCGISWNDGGVISFHGKKEKNISAEQVRLLKLCSIVPKIILFTDRTNNPKSIARFLTENGFGHFKAYIGCNLGDTDENISCRTLEECASEWKDTDQLCVMIIVTE